MSERTQAGLLGFFVEHPRSVGETYLGHMWFAATFAFWLIAAGLAALVHAIIPAFFETTASKIIKRLHARMESRGHGSDS
ncbi:DUF6356 family protein [Parasulfitobacter algicola]|uniref:Capsule biosynthesis protein n=1 Tax=Parasulfitobacter algicola TaxID=2614809 RepID=A0ABX2IPA8_9RHOB|nr:DUF6356 family protein [Sulfitobacter algicola]NSX53816.1 hypothetical protein [Sulfitobacter algicola]